MKIRTLFLVLLVVLFTSSLLLPFTNVAAWGATSTPTSSPVPGVPTPIFKSVNAYTYTRLGRAAADCPNPYSPNGKGVVYQLKDPIADSTNPGPFSKEMKSFWVYSRDVVRYCTYLAQNGSKYGLSGVVCPGIAIPTATPTATPRR